MNNVILHLNNWAIIGGIECTVMDLARAFPQFYHILLTVHPQPESDDCIQTLRKVGVRYMCAQEDKFTEAMLKEVNPSIIFLHNTKGRNLEGEYPYKWLTSGARIIAVHHGVTRPLIPADMDWFVSEYDRRPYRFSEGVMKNAVTLPPAIWPEPFLNISRPRRDKVRIGRVHASKDNDKWKTDVYVDLLKQVKGAEFFVVTMGGKKITDDPRFTFAPIVPGKTPSYLSEMDIFATWTDKLETWGRVATEANLSGIPVVARDRHDALTEQLHKSDGGLLVNSEQEFVEVLQMLVDNEKRRREIGKQGRKWCLENASTRKLQKEWTKLFLDWSVG